MGNEERREFEKAVHVLNESWGSALISAPLILQLGLVVLAKMITSATVFMRYTCKIRYSNIYTSTLDMESVQYAVSL